MGRARRLIVSPRTSPGRHRMGNSARESPPHPCTVDNCANCPALSPLYHDPDNGRRCGRPRQEPHLYPHMLCTSPATQPSPSGYFPVDGYAGPPKASCSSSPFGSAARESSKTYPHPRRPANRAKWRARVMSHVRFGPRTVLLNQPCDDGSPRHSAVLSWGRRGSRMLSVTP